jgi:ElaB/YqjD/DUF883 family membrane-anchored ribosome-binding protein
MGEAAGEVTGWEDRPAGDIPSTADEAANDPEVVQLVSEIEDTRGEMTSTVEEIGERLDPRNIVASATQTVRDATVGKVEEMANTAGDMIDTAGQTAQQAGTGVVETIRRNPIPAALAGLGLGWLAKNARSQGSFGGGQPAQQWRRSTDVDWQYAGFDRRSGGGTAVGHQVGDKVGQVGDAAGQAVSTAQQAAQDVAERVGQTAGEMPRQVEDVARQVGDSASRAFQDNPLAVGAIAVAVGAAVGLALPVTQTERKVLGEARDQVIEKAEAKANEALGEVERQARTN